MRRHHRNVGCHVGVYLPLAPLLDLLLARLGADRPMEHRDSRSDLLLAKPSEMAAMCGVTPRTWYRWAAQERIPWDAADEVAVRLGRHPLSVWHDFHAVIEMPVDKPVDKGLVTTVKQG